MTATLRHALGALFDRRTQSAPIAQPPGRRIERRAIEELQELHKTMGLRLAHLDSLVEDVDRVPLRPLLDEFVHSACSLRTLLVRVAVMAPARMDSSDRTLTESIRWAYLWAVEQLETVTAMLGGCPHYPRVSAIARDVLADFHGLAASREDGDVPPSHPVTQMLRALDSTLYRMILTQDALFDGGGQAPPLSAKRKAKGRDSAQSGVMRPHE
jgi:hypothetical protein